MAIKDKATLLSGAEVIRDETVKNANTATRVGQHLYDVIDSLEDRIADKADALTADQNYVSDAQLVDIGTITDKQDKLTTGTTFDDTSIIVDSTVEYSTVEVITGSTHTITIAAFGHVSGNYKLARYQFDVDCDLTIENYDTAGSTLGTVNPIPAGTYNFWFYATAFGVGLVIQNNTGTTPGTLSTPVIVLSVGNTTAGYVLSAIDTNATAGVLELSTDNISWSSDEDYSFGTTSGTIDGLTNGVIYYVRFRVSATGYLPSAYATGTVTPSLAITQLTAPTANTPTVNSATAITVTCDDPNTSPQETTVLFRRATNSGMTTGLTTIQQAAGTTSYQWTGLTEGVTYYFDIIAQGNGSSTSDSAPSNVVNAIPASQLELIEEKIFDSAGTWTEYKTGTGTITYVTDEGVTKIRLYGLNSGQSVIYKLNAYTTGDVLKITFTGVRHVSTNRIFLTIGKTTSPFNFSQAIATDGTVVFDNINTATFGTDRAILIGADPNSAHPAREAFVRSVKIEKYL